MRIKILALIMLSGCSEYISKENLDYINSQCKNNGGIERAAINGNGYMHIYCNDGAKFESGSKTK